MMAFFNGRTVKVRVPAHALQRWMERVEGSTDPRTEMERFLAGGCTVTSDAPPWLGDRHSTSIAQDYAHNPMWPDITLVLRRDDPVAVVTVVTRSAGLQRLAVDIRRNRKRRQRDARREAKVRERKQRGFVHTV